MPAPIPIVNAIMGVTIRFEVRPEKGRFFPMMVAEAEDGSFVDACLFIGGKPTLEEARQVIVSAKSVLVHTEEPSEEG